MNKKSPCAPCYPAFLDYPHTCSFQSLNLAAHAYDNGSLNDQKFAEWVELNALNYHTSSSAYALSLWEDRLECLEEDYPSQQTEDQSYNLLKANIILGHPFMQPYKCPHHNVYKLKLRRGYSYKNISDANVNILHKLYPPPTQADGKKINIPLTGLVKEMLAQGHVDLVNTVLSLFPIGTWETIVTMHLINALGVSTYGRISQLMRDDKACCLSPEQYNAYAKAIGVAARRCSKWHDGSPLKEEEVCKMSYLEMCLGRIPSISDWDEERNLRCHQYAYLKLPHTDGEPNKQTNDEYLAELAISLEGIFDELVQIDSEQLSWNEFTKQRQLWVTGGSAGGERITIDGELRRIDKRVLFETITTKEVQGWIDSKPEIRAKASEKYEITKPRSIYGACCKSYLILTYLTYKMEYAFSKVEGFQDGLSDLQEISSVYDRIKMVSEEGVHTTMVDYTDFNYQHTLAAQQLMFAVMKKVLIKKRMHPDMIKAAQWAADACGNQYVQFPLSELYERVVQGMFSGVRTTNFMNTIMNKAYYMVADRYVRKVLNIQPVDVNAIHKGDDVWITNKNILYSIALFTSMECSGLKFRAAKQLFGVVGEFLRVRYWKGHAMGYVNRAIGTLTERPVQSKEASSPEVMLQGLRSQINVAFRRGLTKECADLLWEVCLKSWSRCRHPVFRNFILPRHIIEKSYMKGGLDLGPPLTLSVGGNQSAPIPVEMSDHENIAKQVPSHMTKDFTRYISETMKRSFRIQLIHKHIHNANMAGAASSKEHYISLKHHINDLSLWKKNLSNDSTVRRDLQAFDDYINAEGYDIETYQQLDHIKNQKVGARPPRYESMIGHIFKAIHSSPFRDISTAQRATGCNVSEAALLCILENNNTELRQRAFDAFNTLMRRLKSGLFTRILQGLRSPGNNFESVLHPVSISWLNTIALDQAVRRACHVNMKSIVEWDALLYERQQATIVAAIKQGMLRQISGY